MHELEHLSLPLASRRAIVSQFWGVESAQSPKVESEDDPYFSYFEKQCRDARQLDDAVRPVCTQHNICDIIEQLKTGETRENIREKLLQKATDDPFGVLDTRFFDLAIDLAVRLWLMVHVEYVYRGVTSQTSITWQSGTLNEALYGRFRHELILTDQIKLERVFNAMNIERIADVRIQWTPNLVDHLRFIEDGKTPVLNIFYHATFLKYHTDSKIYPPGLIEETRRTLALLLPQHDNACKKWFRSHHSKLRLDPAAINCGQLKLEERQITRFKYWHDRLVVIKQFFDESEPRTIKQWWYDNRKRVQWFWVAIVLVVCTILFGIIQCFEGGWQIWKAYHS